MRRKPNLIPRMERCARVLVENAEDYRGRWCASFPGCNELRLEIGCGKGLFTADTAEVSPGTLFLAVERVPEAIVVAMERVCERGLDNVRFSVLDAAQLPDALAPDEVSLIYLNFCDPWPRPRDEKRRLTSPGFLKIYRDILRPGGEIRFKTDNDALFEYSCEQFETAGFRITGLTNDLHANGPVGVMTDYEAKFYTQGVKINQAVCINGG